MPCPPPEDLTNPGIKPMSLKSSALAGGFFTTGTTWEAHPASKERQNRMADHLRLAGGRFNKQGNLPRHPFLGDWKTNIFPHPPTKF